MKDFYYILGTANNATPAELDAAYKRLSQKLQPGMQEPDQFIESHFIDISEAYDVLRDPVKRRRYDQALKNREKRRLYYFRIRYLSIAATITLIAFTAIFGYYVMQVISGHKTKQTAVLTPVTAKPKHHKKKRTLHTKPTIANYAQIKPTAVISKPTISVTPVAAPVIESAVEKPLPAVTATPPTVRPSGVDEAALPSPTAYLQANITGLVALHQLANYASAVITNMPNHARVQVLEKGPVFYKIGFNSQVGYVPRRNVVTP